MMIIKIIPYQITKPYVQQNKQEKKINCLPCFTSNMFDSYLPEIKNFSIFSIRKSKSEPDWVKDECILKAFSELKELNFNQKDIDAVQIMGAVVPFKSGKDAVKFIEENNTRVKFDTLSSSNIHAQYDYDNNFIKINELYKNTNNPAEILAIAEAILHEAGHAKDKDGENSIQEEINCLSLNVLSHKEFSKKYPNIFTSSDALIIKDGVCVYEGLFFDSDPEKKALINRLKTKYGYLPAGDFNHPPSNLALKVKNF